MSASEPILVCDPDPQIQRALQVILRHAGYKTLSADSGTQALERVAVEHPGAVILELELPDIDGIALCRRLRDHGELAIMVLSAVDEESAKIRALENGADDYITKPFSPGELLARLALRLRAAPSELRSDHDGLEINFTAHRVTLDGQQVHLTPIEFALLRTLATSRGAVSYAALASKLWAPAPVDPARRVRTHIANLRAKLERDHHPNPIQTEVGFGYRLARPLSADAAPRRLHNVAAAP
jgi:two-component system, OmpR family, KDP operon response regulator KdpE